MTVIETVFENIVGKGENAGNHNVFYLSHTNSFVLVTDKLSPVNSFNLDKYKE